MDCCNSETFAGSAGAAEIGAELAASDVAGDVVGVLVEGQQVDLAGFDPAHDLLDSVEAEAFEAQMQPGTGAEPGPGRSQRREELPRRLDAAQAGLPGQRHAVIRRGDAIGQQLPIRLKQRRHRPRSWPQNAWSSCVCWFPQPLEFPCLSIRQSRALKISSERCARPPSSWG